MDIIWVFLPAYSIIDTDVIAIAFAILYVADYYSREIFFCSIPLQKKKKRLREDKHAMRSLYVYIGNFIPSLSAHKLKSTFAVESSDDDDDAIFCVCIVKEARTRACVKIDYAYIYSLMHCVWKDQVNNEKCQAPRRIILYSFLWASRR